jgi:Domain of unknown function (DUF4129)
VNATWPHGDPRAVAKMVLADRRYHAASQPAPKTLWDLFWDLLRKWWDALTAPIGHVLGNDLVTQFVGLAVLAVALAFLAFVAYRFARPYLRKRRARARAAATALAHDGDAAMLRERAFAAANEGRYHDAAALLWASALRALDEAGRVRYDAARTPGEWRREVRDPAFDAFTRDAVVALFGDRSVDEALVVRMRRAYDAIVTTA